MGGVAVGGTFVNSDWRQGIQKIQEDAREYYGDRDGYSGAENSCCFKYAGDKSDLTKKQLEKFIEDRMDSMYNRDGEVIRIGTKGYRLIKTTYIFLIIFLRVNNFILRFTSILFIFLTQ